MYSLLTRHQPVGAKHVTKELYMAFFEMCFQLLQPADGSTHAERQSALEVRSSPHFL